MIYEQLPMFGRNWEEENRGKFMNQGNHRIFKILEVVEVGGAKSTFDLRL